MKSKGDQRVRVDDELSELTTSKGDQRVRVDDEQRRPAGQT